MSENYPVTLLEKWRLTLAFSTEPVICAPFELQDTMFENSGNCRMYKSGGYLLTVRDSGGEDLHIMDFSLSREDSATFTTENYEVCCEFPVVDTYNLSPMFLGYAHRNSNNPPAFLASCTSKDSPYVMYGSRSGENRFTIGLLNQFIETDVTRGGRGGEMYYAYNRVTFRRPVKGVTLHGGEIRDAVYLDTRRDNWYNTTRGYFDFVDERRGYVPTPTPKSAYGPLWCSWLYLTDINEEKIWKSALKAKELGIKTLMIDAGWFCADTDIPFPDSPLDERTFGFGRIDSDGMKFPDMPSLVDRIHTLGLYVWAWCTPRWTFHAKESGEGAVDKRLLDCRIVTHDGRTVPLMCTRHPDSREHAAKFTAYLLKKYHFDGLKFDCWELDGDMDTCVSGHSHDCDTMGEGTLKWGNAIYDAMTEVNPEAVVWLNNTTMKPYSNYSCSPNEIYCQPDENWRMAVLTKTFSNGILAHLCEGSWHPDEPDNTLARQMAISMMGFVPEVQVDLTRLPPGHELVLKRAFAFYTEHREALLRGDFTPFGFEHMLGGPVSTTPPHVKIEAEDEAFCFVGPVVCDEINLKNSPRSVYLFNLKNLDGLNLSLTGLTPGEYEITRYDCYMNTVSQAKITSAGVLPLSSPVGSGAMLSVKFLNQRII